MEFAMFEGTTETEHDEIDTDYFSYEVCPRAILSPRGQTREKTKIKI